MDIKSKEKEMKRIEKNLDPIRMLNLEIPYTTRDIVKSYYKIVRLIHPDKNNNLIRFQNAFQIVHQAYDSLINPQIDQSINNNINEISNRAIIVWQPMALSSALSVDIRQKIEEKKVRVNIAIDGAEHIKNKSKWKSDKHQKGLQQRVIQRQNAERRFYNDMFCFSNKIEIL